MRLLYLGFPETGFAATGGQIVDLKYRDFLNKNEAYEVDCLDYPGVGMTGKYLSNANVSKVVAVLNQYDFVIFDARGFTRFLFNIRRIKKSLKPKLIGVLHHFYFMQLEGIKQIIVKSLELKTLSKLDSIIYSGIYPYEMSKTLPEFKNICLRYIGIGFEKEEIVERNASTNKNIVFIGHIISRKGPHLLLKSLIELKKEGIEPVTYIIGDDKRSPQYTEKLKKTIKENGMEGYVHLTGRINDETKENIMHNSGIFVFPSLCEGYGMVVLETMKYGIPAVVFNNTNLPYIVHDGVDGFVVENKNWKAMKEKIKELILDEQLYRRLSNGAKTSYNNVMTWNEVEDNLRKWEEEWLL